MWDKVLAGFLVILGLATGWMVTSGVRLREAESAQAAVSDIPLPMSDNGLFQSST
jgi:hypothetical protein